MTEVTSIHAQKIMKRYFAVTVLLLCLLAALTGCSAPGVLRPGDGTGAAESSAEETLSASAELLGEGLVLTLHGYYMEEISAKDLQALDGASDPVSAAKALEALRRAAEETRTGGRYHADRISVLVPVTESDRNSGLSPRELAGNIHGWQDAEGEYHLLISAGSEIFWLRWSGEKENAGTAGDTAGPAGETAQEAAAVLVSGKWGD